MHKTESVLAMMKSSVEEIRARFDRDVERFSDLERGQEATIDAALAMHLVAEAAAAATPGAQRLLDIGCGAGNYSLKLLERLPALEVTLLDLSEPMLVRAQERVLAAGARSVRTVQADVREFEFEPGAYDVILAAAVFHHLREDDEWTAVFSRLHESLAPGGSIWIFDLVEHEIPAVRAILWKRYGEYLTSLKGPEYRDKVFAYIEQEDTPRSLEYQLDLLRRVGFAQVAVLHVNGPFAAFGAVRAVY